MAFQPGPGGSILVVEDDVDIRDALTLVLQGEGYQVDSAANGREALDHLRQGSRANLIVLDLMMPIMDGWQFRQEQERDPDLAAIPVMIVSGDGNVKQQATNIGAIDYARKPIDLDLFVGLVGRHCPTGPLRHAGQKVP
jgi:CheY-like chemotaxis protein